MHFITVHSSTGGLVNLAVTHPHVVSQNSMASAQVSIGHPQDPTYWCSSLVPSDLTMLVAGCSWASTITVKVSGSSHG